ncbi:MAG TPA: 2-amino-4-hydroxy-6-hydroxymethyldihydropteridine diphosphokinase [Anaerolineales bacterium]|nr:2-amino-4-hydroxy-6-hydroxymethyldihydropteridine diphosphokinase [Anaerolineales bacterium]
MDKSHLAYLSLGSNIQPEENLVRAVRLLQQHGQIETVSNAWESKSVGAEGPNYLNACLAFVTSFSPAGLKEKVISPIEQALGRKRTGNRFAPRTMDIDIVIFDSMSCDDKYWEQAFVVIPLAEIFPTFTNPLTQEPLHETAARLRRGIWMETRQGILSQFGGNHTRV